MDTKHTLHYQKLILDKILNGSEVNDFFQAVRLISLLQQQDIQNNNLSPVKASNQPKHQLYFKTSPFLFFPVNDIGQAKLVIAENPAMSCIELPVFFSGLYGVNGLLPLHYTELILEKLQHKDTSLSDFFDQFNQRILTLFYQAWKKNHCYVGYEQAQLINSKPDDEFTHILSCLMGENRFLFCEHENMVFYSGAFASQYRSAHRLQQILSDYFGVNIRILQFQCRYLLLPLGMRLSVGRRNNQLGVDTLLGKRILDNQNHFRVCIGPLSQKEFQGFLPDAKNLKLLSRLIKRYVGGGMSFEVQLILKGAEVFKLRLQGNRQLGYDTWLGKKDPTIDVADLVFTYQQLEKLYSQPSTLKQGSPI